MAKKTNKIVAKVMEDILAPHGKQFKKGGKVLAYTGITVPDDYTKADADINKNFALDNPMVKGFKDAYPINPFTSPQEQQAPKSPWLTQELAVGALLGLDALIPGDKIRRKYNRPLNSYNEYGHGTGSQAIFDDGGQLEAKSGIHIKPENKGKFNALKKRTGKSTEELTHSKNPLTRKRAIFAQNAAKWKHEDGGMIPYTATSMKDGGHLSPDKAKEMLRDGTANGKKLTAKQKRYFGMVAAGKAAFGALVPGGDENGEVKMIDDPFKPLRTAQSQTLEADRTHDYVQSKRGQMLANNQLQIQPRPAQTAEALRSGDYFPTPQQAVDPRFQYVKLINPPQAAAIDNGVQRMVRNRFDDGGKIKGTTPNPFDNGSHIFTGPSHEEGGIPIQYGGKAVEVEGGETAFQDSDGALNIFGNLKVPGLNKKFKTVGKEIAKQEESLGRKLTKNKNLLKSVDPTDTYEKLSFNSANMNIEGATKKMQNLAQAKEKLADIQQALLLSQGDPNAHAKWGMKLPTENEPISYKWGGTMHDKVNKYDFAEGGTVEGNRKPSVAERHNNPGNIKFAKWMEKYGAVPGEPGQDGGNFAKFPSIEAGFTVMKKLLKGEKYGKMKVLDAIKTWTNNQPYNVDYSSFGDSTVNQLDEKGFNNLINTITKGEDGKLYNLKDIGDEIQSSLPKNNYKRTPTISTIDPPMAHGRSYTPTLPKYIDPKRASSPLGDIKEDTYVPPSAADNNPFNVLQIAPELGMLATNRVEHVQAQKYQPDLFTPYQVSFQDRRNENQSTFNALNRSLAMNPAAIGTLAAQKYSADNGVNAEEFRTNQGIQNEITNKNVGLLNDAQMKNLGIFDQQMTRQSQAKSNTRAQNFTAFNSIASKKLQHNLENLSTRIGESMFGYRLLTDPDGTQHMGWAGGQAPISINGLPIAPTQQQPWTDTQVARDANGRIIRTTETTPSARKQQAGNLSFFKGLFRK